MRLAWSACLSDERETANVPLSETAIGLDSTVFLRLAGHPRSADIIDYLSSGHSAPLVLPGQVIQEFWNNQRQVVDTVASSLRKQFDVFKTELGKVDKDLLEHVTDVGGLLDQFSAQYGHIYDEGTVRNTLTLLDAISKRAVVAYAPRQKYEGLAALRKRTRTPPGFKDERDGDFYVWIDFLTGLQQASGIGQVFSKVVLVSLDRKIDWSRGDLAHPVLVAEVRALFGVPFEIWTTDKLAKEIAAVT